MASLEKTVDKFDSEIFSFVYIPNHIHLFFRTPRLNLSCIWRRATPTGPTPAIDGPDIYFRVTSKVN